MSSDGYDKAILSCVNVKTLETNLVKQSFLSALFHIFAQEIIFCSVSRLLENGTSIKVEKSEFNSEN